MSTKTACVDLDGVLAKLDKWEGIENFGPVIPGARFFLEELRREGFKIIIHTVRCSPSVNPIPAERVDGPGCDEHWANYLTWIVIQWLRDNNMPFDEIWSGRGKPLADIYIDDCAIHLRPLTDDESAAFKVALEQIRSPDYQPTLLLVQPQQETGNKINHVEIERVRSRLREILAYWKAQSDESVAPESLHIEVDELQSAALRAIPEVADIAELADEIEETVNGFWHG